MLQTGVVVGKPLLTVDLVVSALHKLQSMESSNNNPLILNLVVMMMLLVVMMVIVCQILLNPVNSMQQKFKKNEFFLTPK